MKSVLISIQPKWCELIANGQKTIEVRKTRPKIETPFKCYIYCTKAKYPHEDFITVDAGTENAVAFYGGGKVVGEFICDFIEILFNDKGNPESYMRDILPPILQKTAMGYDEFADYVGSRGKGKDIYGWHISDLVIYDEPKELSDFMRVCDGACSVCSNCQNFVRYGDFSIGTCDLADRLITRAPQSWCYVEEL